MDDVEKRPSLLTLAIGTGKVSEEIASALSIEAEKSGKSPERLLVERKLVTEDQLLALKSTFYHLPSADIAVAVIDTETLRIIPEEVAQNYQMVSFLKKENTLSIGFVDPQNFPSKEAAEFLAKESHFIIKSFVISLHGLETALKKYRVLGAEATVVIGEARAQLEERAAKEGEKFEEVIRAAPISKMVSMILRHAMDSGASDIHIEPLREETRVRFRVDGRMHTVLTLPKFVHAALISRIKVLASLKIDETRLPQDGRISFQTETKNVDLRVSILPLVDAEKVVMRILDTSKGVLSFRELGFRVRSITIMERNIDKPFGIFLITGPTGSGKTTTLYTALSIHNTDETAVVTLEDPVEYYMPGVSQSQVNPEVGLTFAAGLRAILRQDPDVIMVGEIRDQETGDLAINAGLTGHLVFSTLHTNDAFGAIPRLVDMGLQPFLLVSALNMVMAQRLVRRICESCKEETTIPANLEEEVRGSLIDVPASLLKETFSEGGMPWKFFKGKGCKRCGDSGYKGRTTIGEFVEMTEEMKKIVIEGSDPKRIKDEAKNQEMITMKQDGLLKVLEGLTTLEEVLSVTKA